MAGSGPPDDSNVRRTWTGLYVPNWYDESSEPDISPLDAEAYETQLDALAQFEAHPEIRCIWEFDLSQGPLQGLSFAPGATQIRGTDYWIVCPFVPGKLFIHSPVVSRAGRFQYALSHTVLFDSNIYSRIVRFVERPELLSAAEERGVRTLLETLIVRKYDYQLMPYMIESFAKKVNEFTYDYARRGTRAILSLHMMDKEHFLATGSVRPDPGALSAYEVRFGTTDLDSIVTDQLQGYVNPPPTPIPVTIFTIVLLKMVLIRRCLIPTRSFDAQWSAFDDFFFSRLGIYSGQARTMALFYFSGKLDHWIKTQQNSDPEQALDLLTNSAWDLYLGSLPQHVLAHSPESEPVLCHFCTREAELAELLSASLIQALRVSKTGGFVPFLNISTDLLHSAIGPGSQKSLALADERAARFLKERESGTTRRIDENSLSVLVTEVKAMFRALLGR